jgi:4'-phosphopantetheinyl transferase
MVDLPDHRNWLSGRERAILSAMRFPKRIDDWLLGRWTVKALAAHYLREYSSTVANFAEIEVLAGKSGAPYINCERLCGTVVSISHSHGVAFCVLDPMGKAIGCDIEYLEPRSAAFIRDYFTEAEQRQINRAAIPDRHTTANLLWSAKESVLKSLSSGLRTDTRKVEIDFPDAGAGGAWRCFRAKIAPSDDARPGKWQILDDFVLTIFSEEDIVPAEAGQPGD